MIAFGLPGLSELLIILLICGVPIVITAVIVIVVLCIIKKKNKNAAAGETADPIPETIDYRYDNAEENDSETAEQPSEDEQPEDG